MDSAHVPDLRSSPHRYPADRRPGYSQRDPQGLRDAGIADCGGNGADGGALAALLHGRELVSVEESGAGRQPVKEYSLDAAGIQSASHDRWWALAVGLRPSSGSIPAGKNV